jgi:hypothetical protein
MATFDSSFDAVGGGGGGGEDLAATLVLGNITGGTDVVVSSGDAITGVDAPGAAPDNGFDLIFRPGAGTAPVAASGTFTIVNAPLAVGDILSITLFGRTLTGVAGPRAPGADDFDATIGTTAGLAIEIAAAINDPANTWGTGSSFSGGGVTALAVGSTVVVTSILPGTGKGDGGALSSGGAGTNPRGTAAVDLQFQRNPYLTGSVADQVAGAPYSVLVGGFGNRILPPPIPNPPNNSRSTAIVGGYNNTIGGSESYGSSILAGSGNTIGFGGTYTYSMYNAAIVGGGYNTIIDYSGGSVILGGWNNRIGGGPYPGYFNTGAVVSGSGNVSEGNLPWGGSYYSLNVGRNNEMKGGQNSGIVGRFCEVWNQNSFAGGNVVRNRGYSTFMWGQNNDTHYNAHYNGYSDFASAFGFGAYLYVRGQAAWSSRNTSISQAGEFQRCSYSLLTSTSNATPREMSTDGGTVGSQADRLRIMPGRCYSFRIQLAAYQTSVGPPGARADSATWEITGAIKRDLSNNTTLIGVSGAGLPLFADAAAAGWSVAVTADDVNESLRIVVTGEASKIIRWHAAVHTSEVGDR